MKALLLASALLLGSCSAISSVQTAANSSPSPAAIADARTGVLGVENLYGLAVISADHWASLPRCGLPGASPAPLCSTAVGTIALNKAAVAFKAGIAPLEAAVLKASPTQSDLSLAVSGAQALWSAYQAAVAPYGIKTTN